MRLVFAPRIIHLMHCLKPETKSCPEDENENSSLWSRSNMERQSVPESEANCSESMHWSVGDVLGASLFKKIGLKYLIFVHRV